MQAAAQKWFTSGAFKELITAQYSVYETRYHKIPRIQHVIKHVTHVFYASEINST